MILNYKYKGSLYDPNNRLDMYDLIRELRQTNYILTDREQRVKELEERNHRLQREVARLDRLIKS